MGPACGACERYNEKIDILTEKISSYEQLEEAIKQGYKFIVIEETVIDINSIMSKHPGGSEILKKFVGILDTRTLGREIGRLFYGGYNSIHSHSDTAIKMVDRMVVGIIKNSLDKIIFRATRKQAPSEIEKEAWKLVSRKNLSETIAVFQFRSPNFKVAGILPNFDHCGKYFTVSILRLIIVVCITVKKIQKLWLCFLFKRYNNAKPFRTT